MTINSVMWRATLTICEQLHGVRFLFIKRRETAKFHKNKSLQQSSAEPKFEISFSYGVGCFHAQ